MPPPPSTPPLTPEGTFLLRQKGTFLLCTNNSRPPIDKSAFRRLNGEAETVLRIGRHGEADHEGKGLWRRRGPRARRRGERSRPGPVHDGPVPGHHRPAASGAKP